MNLHLVWPKVLVQQQMRLGKHFLQVCLIWDIKVDLLNLKVILSMETPLVEVVGDIIILQLV